MAKDESRLRKISKWVKMGALGSHYMSKEDRERTKKLQKKYQEKLRKAQQEKRLQGRGTMRMNEAW